jgi:hypothetical protein
MKEGDDMNRKILVMILADLNRNGENSVFYDRFEKAVRQCLIDGVGILRSEKMVDKYSFLIIENGFLSNAASPWTELRFVKEIGGMDALVFEGVDLASSFDEHDLVGLCIAFRWAIVPFSFFDLCKLEYDQERIKTVETLLEQMWKRGTITRQNMHDRIYSYCIAP